MARPWQLRHKLVLGLGLVVASVGLLLGGALVTLSSYVEAGQVTVHRIALIQVVVILKQDLHEIAVTGPYTGNRDAEKQHILLKLTQAKKTIDTYRMMRADGPGAGTPTVVTLGDSAISGEAGRWAAEASRRFER